MLPWDIPWYDPGHAVFFGVLYGVLTILVIGLTTAGVMTVLRLKRGEDGHDGHHGVDEKTIPPASPHKPGVGFFDKM